MAGGFEFCDGKAVEAEELFERDALGGCDRLVGVTLLDDVEIRVGACRALRLARSRRGDEGEHHRVCTSGWKRQK